MNYTPWDAIIVGARCAGAVTAYHLARRGHHVLVLDRARFPSDTLSTHNFGAETALHFDEMGLLEEIEATAAPPLTRTRFVAPDQGVGFSGRVRPAPGGIYGHCVRRTHLDEMLVRAARAAGAEVREGSTVDRLVWDDDQAGGVVIQADGKEYKELAQVVIGADGRHSRVARWVRAGTYRSDPAVTPGYYAYFRDFAGPRDTVEIVHTDRRDCIIFPTDGGLTCVLLALPQEQLAAFRADHEGNFMRDLRAVPELAERLAGAERVGPVRGATDLESYLRVPYGPGWLLVGDAGAHIHPTTARGISLAVRDAELLAERLSDALAGNRDPGEALGEFHRLRDAETDAEYTRALQMARMTGRPLPPEMAQLWSALGALPDAADDYLNGRLRIEGPDDVAALVERAGHAGAAVTPGATS